MKFKASAFVIAASLAGLLVSSVDSSFLSNIRSGPKDLSYTYNIDQLNLNSSRILQLGYSYDGELPPYRDDAPWLASFSRVHVDYLPRATHEALFFNNENTFSHFVTLFKGVLKEWATEARAKDLIEPQKIHDFFRGKLDEYYQKHEVYFKHAYPGLTEKQYRLLLSMNLAHGNYEFDTQTKTVSTLLELIELEFGDCSELADLVASLAFIQGIEGKFLGLGWDYESSIGPFISGHQVFYAEGLWIDAEINIAFKFKLDEIMEVEPEKRLLTLIDRKSVLGFYNWYLKPDVRQKQLERNQDGGAIAFFYYYYFEGLGQGRSNILPYFPRVVLDNRFLNTLTVAGIPTEKLGHTSYEWNEFELFPGKSAFLYWESELLRILNQDEASMDYSQIINYSSLFNSLTYLINIYNSSEEIDLVKLVSLTTLAIRKIDQIMSVRGVFEGQVKGWGRADAGDAFQNGIINPEYSKYTYQTFEIAGSILNLTDAIQNNRQLSRQFAEQSKNYIEQIETIIKSWDTVYFQIEKGKGYYGYSEYKHDKYSVINITGSAISMHLVLHRLTGNTFYLARAKELIAYLLDYIKIDSVSGAYIWPYDLSRQRIEDVRHGMITIKGIINATNQGWIDNFEVWRLEETVRSFWSKNSLYPNIYIASPNANAIISDSTVATGINLAQFYQFQNSKYELWEIAKSHLITTMLSSKHSSGLTLELISLLLNTTHEVEPNRGRLSFTSDGGVVNTGEIGITIDPLLTRGNSGQEKLYGEEEQPIFEIFEKDNLVLNVGKPSSSEGKLLISLTYQSHSDVPLQITSASGWKEFILLPNSMSDPDNVQWVRNSAIITLPSELGDLVIEVNGPIKINNFESFYLK